MRQIRNKVGGIKMDNKILELRYKFNNEILERNCAEVLIAFNPETSDMYEFNETGAEIFQMLKEEMSIQELFEQLCDAYEVKIDDILEDVQEIIERMIELEVIYVE